jgi:hypothetical protein
MKLSDRVREIEAREQQWADRVREIEAREQQLADRERLLGKSSAEEAERVWDAIVALQAAGASSGDVVFAEAAAKLQTFADAAAKCLPTSYSLIHAQTVASVLLQARCSWLEGHPSSAVAAIKRAEVALRNDIVLLCSSRSHPGNKAEFEMKAREAYSGSMDLDMSSALSLSWHKWHGAARTPSKASRRKPRARRLRQTGKHPRSHSAPPSTGEGQASGSFHEASGDAEDESGTHLGHMGSEGDLRRAIRLAVAVFITADMGDAAHLGLP